MKTVTFEIPDDIYQIIQDEAARTGRSIQAIALDFLMIPPLRPKLTEEEKRQAHARFLRHAGAVDSGDPHSADNDRIDADLAREYANNHEDES